MVLEKKDNTKAFFNKILDLKNVNQYSKHEQLIQGVINSIDEKILVQGNMLPSVNNMVKELGFSSRTIAKAYRELVQRGLIESKNRLGYFVVNEDTDQTAKVALLLYAFHPIQETFYNAFRTALGENIQIDIFFHHSNIDVFETMIGNIKGQYGVYVVAPIPHQRTKKILSEIPGSQLLIVDRFEPMDGNSSYVAQEFEHSTFRALEKLVDAIRRFDKMILFLRSDADQPVEIGQAFGRFLETYKIEGQIRKSYVAGTLEARTVYFTISDSDLWGVLRDSKKQGFEVGRDIGVLSNSEDPVKEIICDGITTNSIDFSEMGQIAAEFVLNRELIKTIVPTKLTRRKSL